MGLPRTHRAKMILVTNGKEPLTTNAGQPKGLDYFQVEKKTISGFARTSCFLDSLCNLLWE